MFKKIIAVLLISAAIYWSYTALLPSQVSDIDTAVDQFSSARALVHLREISKEQHPVGSKANTEVRNYIIAQLEDLGLETQVQEGFSLTKWGNLVKPKNILARIKGSNSKKALLLLSHYDSAPHSSYGASDAGSGVVTILEGVRAYMESSKTPKNDIIILITDAEELGLNGADLFVNKHEWAKDVGLVLNFEARGSGGPSFMLVETNSGNANLIDGYTKANPSHPVGNSLAYSIYKMLPNDTDLTRFREDGNIDGFNFAFIDDHYDYHTSMDTFERLDRNTLEHQGRYLMSMMHYFADADLTTVKSREDKVYFNVPLFKTVSYPFSWIWPMQIVALLLFVGLIVLGFKKRKLIQEDVIKGFYPLLLSLLSSLLMGFLLWEIIKIINPQYKEMLHGFTYNGHLYIIAFCLISLAICSWIYSRYYKPGNTVSILVAPILLWWLISLLMVLYLKGASFFVVPVYFGCLSLFLLIQKRKPSLAGLALICFPMLFVISPFLEMFPVGLGFFMGIGGLSLTIKLVSMFLVVLMFGLLISIFGFFRHKRRWAYVIFFVALCYLIAAQFKSGFNEERPKPNSLVFMQDIDKNVAYWATYDGSLDYYTSQVLDEATNAVDLQTNIVGSKYNSGFTYSKNTDMKALIYPEIEVYRDTIIGDQREVSIYVASKRNVQRIELFSSVQNIFKDAVINGIPAYKESLNAPVFNNRRSNRLFSYYVTDNEPLDMKFTIPRGQRTELVIYESSNDLLQNNSFGLQPRSSAMIAKPFILNDAVILMKTIVID